jgi:hypothetical protein
MSADEVCQTAQNLARNCGYAVFPVLNTKAPATPHGYLDAQTQPDEIANLWRRYPGLFVGVATGARSGISVLDVDSGAWPDDAKSAIVEKHQAARFWWHKHAHRIPPTRIYGTRSGGLHVVFRHRPGVGATQSKIHQGIDTRGDGALAIWWFAAGFPCHCHEPPAPWPDWLVAPLIEQPIPPPRPLPSRRRSFEPSTEQTIETAKRWVRSAPEGMKHERLRQAAKLLGGVAERAKFSDDEAVAWLRDCLPNTVADWKGAEKTARWGLTKGRQSPLELRAR